MAAGAGFAATFALAAGLTPLRSDLSSPLALGLFAAVVVLMAWWMSPTGAVVTAALGFLMLDGFVVDQYAVLRWHGPLDGVRLAVLVGCAGMAVGARQLRLRRPR